MATASDNFNTGTGALSASWTLIDPGSANLRVLSNECAPNAPGSDGGNWWNADTFGPDQFSQFTMVSPVGGSASDGVGFGVILRASGAAGSGTFYRIVANAAGSGNIEIGRRATGAYTFIATRSSASAFVNGDVLRAEVQGTTIRVYRNGVQAGADITDANIATGQPGLGYSSTMTSGSMDDWSGGDLVAATTVTVIDIFDPIPFMSTGRI